MSHVLPAQPVDYPPDIQRVLADWSEACLAYNLRYSATGMLSLPEVADKLHELTGKPRKSRQAVAQQIGRVERQIAREQYLRQQEKEEYAQ